MNKPYFPCSECGSRNTELRDTPPTGWLEGVKKKLFQAMSSNRPGMPMGQKFVVCKDCGHVSCIHIL